MSRTRRRTLLFGAPMFLALAVLPACPDISRPPDAQPTAAQPSRCPIVSRPADGDVRATPLKCVVHAAPAALRPAELVVR